MYVDFDQMPSESRIWIYQAGRSFTEQELKSLAPIITDFLNQWTKHGSDLKASYKVMYNRFLIIAVDEAFNGVSGCSIDASVHFLQELEKHLEISLLDKMQIAFKVDSDLKVLSLMDFSKSAKSGQLGKDPVVFNNLIQSKGELETSWEVPASKSWHKRYFS